MKYRCLKTAHNRCGQGDMFDMIKFHECAEVELETLTACISRKYWTENSEIV